MIAIVVAVLTVIVIELLIGLFMLDRAIRLARDIKEAVWSINTMVREQRACILVSVGNDAEDLRATNVGGPTGKDVD